MKPGLKKQALFALLALGMSSTTFAAQSDAEFLAAHGLAGKTTEQMVEAIDGSPQARPLPYNAGITSTELKLSDGTQRFSYPLTVFNAGFADANPACNTLNELTKMPAASPAFLQ